MCTEPRVLMVIRKRRLIAIVCLAAMLMAVFAPSASAPHAVVLLPVDPLFGLVVVSEPIVVAPPALPGDPLLETTGSRPPPHSL